MNIIALSEERDMETSYGYCNEYQPHAVRRMFDSKHRMLYDMRWDKAGNLGQVSIARPGDMFETGRFLFWTEDNRLHTVVDDRHHSYYAYDHSGGSCASREQSQACLSYAEMEQRRRSQRRLKLTGDNKLLDVNADFMATYTLLNEPTLYPSAYMVLTNKGYTKHYYAGTERVAARLGGGGLDALQPVIGNDVELQKKADILFKQSLEQVNGRILDAKIKKQVSFHSARHTFCVLLLTKEVPIYTVQQLMCHSDIGTTKVYADLLNKTKAKALRKLPTLAAHQQ